MHVDSDRAFGFLEINSRCEKPRDRGITEIRGPYYSAMGPRCLADVLETMGNYVDVLKYAGGSFSLMPRAVVQKMIDLAHQHDVLVSTGGFIEHVLTLGTRAVDRYLRECRDLGFDIVELSAGFITIPLDDWVQLVRRVTELGMKAKPEIGIQFGAGGASSVEALEDIGTGDPRWMIHRGQRLLDAGAYMLMIESEGITESVRRWRTDVPAQVVNAFGLEHVMFEAADPAVFGWYIRNFGAEVNLFVDHSQIVQLECLRSGIWGTADLWGRVCSYKPGAPAERTGDVGKENHARRPHRVS